MYVHLFYNNVHKTKKEIKYKAQQKKEKIPHLVYKTIIIEDGEESEESKVVTGTKEEDANKVMNNDVMAPTVARAASEASLNNSLHSICGGVP